MLHIHWMNYNIDDNKIVYNPDSYFEFGYEDSWIINPIVKEMIKDIDKSEVISSNLIQSPFLGPIPPVYLSGGVKTLIMILFDKTDAIQNLTNCGDNCAKWIGKISELSDKHIVLNHMFKFDDNYPFKFILENNRSIISSEQEFIDNLLEINKWQIS